ncbi:hypothetical protein [Pseudomonas protegens]|uniref:hypothetical protein n=1 Tax=Pseudomonas protegens TaxID=380021 RepID=UPI001E294E8B|nr:hypothetical protein [Pseudomonas protegens]MCD9568500.1 hypothetical protein [Pseudomonas protegens]
MITEKPKMFRVLPHSQLTEAAFDFFPVWSEHYDFDEIDDVVRWGLDREQVLALFEINSPLDEHCVYTLLESNPFPPRMRIYIRATIETADGKLLKGSVMNEDAFCLEVFHAGAVFTFSRHPMLRNLNQKEEIRLLKKLGPNTQIFPYHLSYRLQRLRWRPYCWHIHLRARSEGALEPRRRKSVANYFSTSSATFWPIDACREWQVLADSCPQPKFALG